MKGTYFEKPFEYRVELEGERWRQGDELRGRLISRSLSGAAAPGAKLELVLAKPSRLAAPSTRAQAKRLYTTELAPEQGELVWSVRLPVDVAITDSSASICALYGPLTEGESRGVLQLEVVPHEVIERCVDAFATAHRFVRKSAKAAKQGCEFKLLPPSGAQAFARIEALTLQARLDGEEALWLSYDFSLARVEALSGALGVKKSVRRIEQCWSRAQYRLASGRIDPEVFERAGASALAAAQDDSQS